MRHSKTTAEEIEAAEKAADDRRNSRKLGFQKMYERDQVMKTLSNGVKMLWHVPPELVKTPPGGVWPKIPDDQFVLVIEGKEYWFDLEEFRRWLRWA